MQFTFLNTMQSSKQAGLLASLGSIPKQAGQGVSGLFKSLFAQLTGKSVQTTKGDIPSLWIAGDAQTFQLTGENKSVQTSSKSIKKSNASVNQMLWMAQNPDMKVQANLKKVISSQNTDELSEATDTQNTTVSAVGQKTKTHTKDPNQSTEENTILMAPDLNVNINQQVQMQSEDDSVAETAIQGSNANSDKKNLSASLKTVQKEISVESIQAEGNEKTSSKITTPVTNEYKTVASDKKTVQVKSKESSVTSKETAGNSSNETVSAKAVADNKSIEGSDNTYIKSQSSQTRMFESIKMDSVEEDEEKQVLGKSEKILNQESNKSGKAEVSSQNISFSQEAKMSSEQSASQSAKVTPKNPQKEEIAEASVTTSHSKEKTVEASSKTDNPNVTVKETVLSNRESDSGKKDFQQESRRDHIPTAETVHSRSAKSVQNDASQNGIKKESETSFQNIEKGSSSKVTTDEVQGSQTKSFDAQLSKAGQSTSTENSVRTSTPVMKESVIDQVVPNLTRMFQRGETRVEMQLYPKELGALKVEVSSDKGLVTANLRVENQEVRQIVETALPELKQSLEKQGIEIDQIQVSVNKDSQALADQSQNSNRSFKQNDPQYHEETSEHEQRDSHPHRQGEKQFGYNSREFVA